jgi:hypothetical protein
VPLQETGALLPKQELLDHFTQHVQKCPACSKVLFIVALHDLGGFHVTPLQGVDGGVDSVVFN